MSLLALRNNSRFLSALPFAVLAIVLGGMLALTIGRLQDPKLAIAFIGVGIGSILVIVRPKIGILVMTVITYTNLSDVLISFHGLPSIAQPFMVLLIISVSLNWLYTRQRPVGWFKVLLWLLLNEILLFISLFYADNLARAETGLEDFTKNAIVALLVAMLVQDIKTLRFVIWTMLAVAILLGTISTYQTITGTYSNNYWGLGQVGVADLTDTTANRIAGPYKNANFYAQMLLLFIPMALDRLQHEKRAILRALAVWALFVSVLAVILTFSRGGFLALVLMMAYIFVRRPPSPLVLALMLGLSACIFPLIPANYIERITSIVAFSPFGQQDIRNDISFRGRSSENLVGWLMFRDYPILGVGKGNYKARYLEYSSSLGIDPRLEDRSAHNLYLEVAAEQGVVGLVLFFAMLWFTFKTMRRSQALLSNAGQEGDADMMRSMEYGLVGYLVAAIFLHMAYPRPFWFMLGLCMSTLHIAQNGIALQLKQKLNDLRLSSKHTKYL